MKTWNSTGLLTNRFWALILGNIPARAWFDMLTISGLGRQVVWKSRSVPIRVGAGFDSLSQKVV